VVEGEGEMTFREDGHAAVDWAADYLERVRELPVLAQVKPGDIRARLPQSPPDQPEPFEAVLRDLDEILLPGVTHWQHPRFFAYFSGSAAEPGILAELLAATLNSVGFLWRTAPASTELELLTCDWVAQLLGLPAGWHGHIEDTASTSTLAALIAARHITGRNVVVASEHAHSAAEKAARMLQMEFRSVPTDDEFRMRPDALELDDVAVVVATVGTTSVASVDPVPAIADRCAEAGAWLHVDAAYAGSAMVCPEFRWAFAGVERADSLVVNAHKWMFTPMDCSLLWTSRPDEFRDAFSLVPEFLRTTDEGAFNLSEYGPVLGRRFRSLKLWAILRCFGREGLQERIRDGVRLAELFESWVRDEPGWELCAPRHFSLVCFRKEGSDEENEALLERANASGELFISHTKLNGRYVLRLALGNVRTTEEDVRRAWDVLRDLR
jgi:aromatic-L-amino-acid/L-tryptophan decarboxylase